MLNEQLIKKLANKKVAVRISENADIDIIRSIEECADLQGVLLDNNDMFFWNGYGVIDSYSLAMAEIEIVITNIIDSDIKDLHRLSSICLSNGIEMVDFRGNDLAKTLKSVWLQKVKYFKKNYDELIKNVDKNDIIIFDLKNLFFIYDICSIREIAELVWVSYPGNSKVDYLSFREMRDELEKSNIGDSIDLIYEKICQKFSIDEDRDELIEIEKCITYEHLKVRDRLGEVYRYAKENNKILIFTSDLAIRKNDLITKLCMSGFGDFNDLVTTDYSTGITKYTLLEEIRKTYAGSSCLYICSNDTDALMAETIAVSSYVLYNPFDTLQISDYAVSLSKKNYANNRWLLGDVLIGAFKNPFVLYDSNGRPDIDSVWKKYINIYQSLDMQNTTNSSPQLLHCGGDENIVPLSFAMPEKPMVSIIIPVYNQFIFTYMCLKTIATFIGDSESYEIIIADDNSNDRTQNIADIVSGVRIVRNEKNLMFLKNCNNAAQFAKGKYLVFLNNDTQVQPGWLSEMLRLMEGDESIGMTGSKIVYPNGLLQEAGGILWKDGSAWNYGNMQSPDTPEFNYLKDADYISGASIMIRKELWDRIGGFDELFAPAYYEDTDLAFAVRKEGYRVVYQPKSVVVHFEGASNGTDLTSGIKAYQNVNAVKFFDKWKADLSKHFENGESIYLAKDRGYSKKQILVIDHYVPNYDKDAGGRCTFMYLKQFVEFGWKVTFIGDDFSRREPYTTILQQMGIEVLYGDYYYLHWQDWMQTNLKYFDYVYLQRPHISIKYIDVVRKYSKAKILYFAHDLHHVRLHREYLLTKDKAIEKEAKYWKKIELELFDKADVGHVVGSYEQKIMQEMFPDKPIRNIPLYIYPDSPNGINKDFSKRNDMVFVGGFGHHPNIDAVSWFTKEVFPKVLERIPNLKWHIVGSNAPEEILNLANDNIIIEGFVSDEKLEQIYRECRIAVVPLRYGAGVKGKVVEAAYYQIPMVTTSIGGEGLDSKIGSFIMVDEADEMAESIISLYNDFDRLRNMSDAGAEFINKYFTPEVARQVLLADLTLD